jgi:hypothetical protein
MKQAISKTLFLIIFSTFSFLSTSAQTGHTAADLLNDDFIYVDSTGAFGTMDSTLLDIIANFDSSYIFVDSLGNLVTTDSIFQSLLDSIDVLNFGSDSTFFDIVNVDSTGNFQTNDSIIMQLLNDSTFISVDSFGNYVSYDTSFTSIINGTFSPPDSTNNILQQDSTYLSDSLLIHSDSLYITDIIFEDNFDSIFVNFNDSIFTVTPTDTLVITDGSLDIFNSLNLFDIDSFGNVTNSIFPEEDYPLDTINPLLNKLIFKVGTERIRVEHYGLIYEPKYSFYFGVSQLRIADDSKIGLYYQASISGIRKSDPVKDATNKFAPKISLSLADMNLSPFLAFNVGKNNTKLIASAGIYASILIPEFRHDTEQTEDNIGNTTGYGSHVMIGAIYNRLFLEFSGRFGQIANSDSNSGNKDIYNHKGISASMDYSLKKHISLHVAYRYETFANKYDKTSSSLRLGMGIVF